MHALSLNSVRRSLLAAGLILLLGPALSPQAQGDGLSLTTASDGGVPIEEVLLSPPELMGDPRAEVSVTMEGIIGGGTSAGVVEALGEVGVVLTLHCPDAHGHAGDPIPFDVPVLCEVDLGGAWVPTHERVVVLEGLPEPHSVGTEAGTLSWELLRLEREEATIPDFDPKDTMAVRDIGMTDHLLPQFGPDRKI